MLVVLSSSVNVNRECNSLLSEIASLDYWLRPKKRPRGKPFEKGKRHPFQYRPGQSGNPGGKPKVHQTMKMNFEHMLQRIAPAKFCQAAGIPRRSTWAEVIAASMVRRAALSDSSAAKEIREVTEGRLAPSVEAKGVINYSAGKSAKELLLGKLV